MKVGDCYQNRSYNYDRVIIIMINDSSDKFDYRITYKSLSTGMQYHWDEKEFNEHYTYSKKITQEQIIKDIIE